MERNFHLDSLLIYYLAYLFLLLAFANVVSLFSDFFTKFMLLQLRQRKFRSIHIQTLQGIGNIMYSKHNGDNAKLRIFSFISQQQRIQPNFTNDSIRTFIHSKQLNTHAQPKLPKQRYQRGFH